VRKVQKQGFFNSLNQIKKEKMEKRKVRFRQLGLPRQNANTKISSSIMKRFALG